MKQRALKTAAAVLSIAGAATLATANTISVGLYPTIAPTAGGYDWVYDATLVNSYLQPGESRIVIFDFAGYVPGGETTPAGWVFSTVPTGPAALATSAEFNVPSHNDSPEIINLLWDYAGIPGIIPKSSDFYFGAVSIYDEMVQNSYGSRDRAVSGDPESNSAAQGPTMVPRALVTDSGTTLGLIGVGLLCLTALRRRFN